MHRHVLAQVIGAFALMILLLALVWLLSPSTGQASPPQPITPKVDLLPPDPRWLALVRAKQPLLLNTQQASAPSINLNLTAISVAGRVATGATVVISVTRAGSLVANATASPLFVDDGYLYMAYPGWTGYATTDGGGGYYFFEAGDIVWVAQASATVSMTVPALTALADSFTDAVYGTAPLSQSITAYVFPLATPDVTLTRTATADGAGHYQANFAPTDLRRRDSGYVVYAEAVDRRAYARFVAPLLRAQVNGHELSGYAAPSSSVAIVAANAQGVPRAWAYANAGEDGTFRIWNDGWNGTEPLQPGDRITATAAGQSFAMTVLSVTAHSDLANHQVWGEAPGGQPVDVLRFSGPIQSSYDYVWSTPPVNQVSVTATLTGHYTASMLLARPDYGAALVTAPDGNQTYARFNVPYVWVRMGEGDPYSPWDDWLRGQVDELAAPITIAVQGPSGYLKDLRHTTAYDNGFFGDQLWYPNPLILDSGDVITLTTPRGVQVALALPLLTAQADPISDTVYGLAPPGSQLTITVQGGSPAQLQGGPAPTSTPSPPGGGGPGYSQHTLVVTATAQGNYRADFSQWINITGDSTGEVQWTTPDGNTLVRAFRATPSCQPRLQIIQVGGNYLQFAVDGQQCPTFIVRLRDPQGQIKAELAIGGWGSNVPVSLYDRTGRPIPILPGDSIEIAPGGTGGATPTPTPPPWALTSGAEASSLFTIAVPMLNVALDPVANVVSGQAPPGAALQLDVYHAVASQHEWLTATASAQGAYSVILSSPYVLQAGDSAQVSLPSFYATGVLPMLQATLYQGQIMGLLTPLSPYTVSLTSSRSISAEMSGYADTTGYFARYLDYVVQPGDMVTVTTPGQVLRLTLPFLSASVDRNTATVQGQAPPNARLQVSLASDEWNTEAETVAEGGGGWYIYGQQFVTATASGLYTATFPDLAPLPNVHGTLVHFNQDGHQTRLEFSTAFWQVILGSYCVNGDTGTGGVPYTVTLASMSGAIKGIYTSPATDYSGSFSACFQNTIEAGDRLTLTQPGGLMTFSVPELTAKHDYARQVLEGQAPPNSTIEADVPFSSGYITVRHTQADASGHYGLDTSDLPVQLLQPGYVLMMDKAGNTILRGFIIQGYPAYLPLVRLPPNSGN
jgi:hypothetical protein